MAHHRVAIIGAGPAGIVAVRLLTHPPSDFEIVVFEKTDRCGGIWNYDAKKGPMYYNLRTNLPKPVMAFHDCPFKEPADNSFPTHRQVLDYINEYVDGINARKMIKFNTEVTRVEPVDEEDRFCRWLVATSEGGRTEESVFDTVFVCNGHYEVPNVPSIPGMDDFPGQKMHSIDYKVPEVFSHKKVVLLGAMASGQDIAIDMAPYAREVVVSHAYPKLPCRLPDNVSEAAAVVSFKDGAFLCSDGSAIAGVDAFVFCTGYQYSFPFLAPACGVAVREGRCHALWKHLVNISHPSMFLVGLCQKISPMPQFAMQCALARAIIERRFRLPSSQEMQEELDEEFERKVASRGAKPRHLHLLADEQWAYNDELARLAGYPPIARHVSDMYRVCAGKRSTELTRYREYSFELLPSGDFCVKLQEDKE